VYSEDRTMEGNYEIIITAKTIFGLITSSKIQYL
jgi:hypothetical protein